MSDNDPFGATRKFSDDPDESSVDAARASREVAQTNQPERIGRYRIERVLGKGGFGLVYLAYDDQLSRRVAVKVPHARLVSRSEDADAHLTEARTVANLDHPHIVPVHDVGSTNEFPCYIVSKYVEGSDLATKLKQSRLKQGEATEMVATVAEALHYAHKQGLVHRDVKTANILVGVDGKPYVVDFGLALREENIGKGPRHAGTPAFMSPEQARGEGHRVDGRSDIYSLGAVFYELLTGKRTVSGGTRSQILEQIATREPKPPRQIDDAIPRELERICLKALAKRASERYTTALDMADDLRHFLAEHPAARGSAPTRSGASQPGSDSTQVPIHLNMLDSESRPIRIVPKGLRSFDAHDADFFLELLPGARDREGLPHSLRFWKTRIEETDPDDTFSVGLIYGPSGCGKSSLIKAGLLPRLPEEVITIYLEASPDDTEARLLRGLRKRCPALPNNLGLKDTLAALRQREGLAAGKKVLIILDQFEQWLHAKKEEKNTELVQSLRQCDGKSTQCIVMVRDDFWLAVSRFLRELEVRLIEGHNSSLVDLFDLDHAWKVLAAFGRAFGKLPENSKETTREQRDFIEQSVAGLAEEGKVICVRLALFSEMMKGKSWTPATLREVGGTAGVGVTFLEETFASSTAPPEHHLHQKAARAVLNALLPKSATDIKGQLKSRHELLEASGYADRPHDFDDLIRILDSEIRLITPTDPESVDSDEEASSVVEIGQKYYQLTHDYLVHSLRDWLTRKQRETRRGRAELQLAERSALWNVIPKNRLLPTSWEYLSILGLTARKDWSVPERRMMVRAGRVHGIRWIAGFSFLLVILAGAVTIRNRVEEYKDRTKVNGLIDQLLVADITEVPGIVVVLEKHSELSVPRLSAVSDDRNGSNTDRLRATFALANCPGDRATRLIEFALSSDLQTLIAIRDRVAPFAEELKGELWEAALRKTSPRSSRLRIGTLLAVSDPVGPGWSELAPSVVNALLAENTLNFDTWVDLLRPVAPALVPGLRGRFFDDSATSAERVAAARALARYADAALLSELLLEADAPQFSMLFPGTSRHRDAVIETLGKQLRQDVDPFADGDSIRRAARLRNAAVTLLRLEQPDDVRPLLSACADPTARTMMILDMRELGVSPELLVRTFDAWRDPPARQALLLALEAYRGQELSLKMEQTLPDLLKSLLRDGSHQPERSAAEWLLRRWVGDETVGKLTRELSLPAPPSADWLRGHDWWVTSEGHTMAVVHGPVDFNMGSPENEPGREDGETLTARTIARSFAVSIHEVTIQQFQRFRPDADFATDVAEELECPANKVSLVSAMQYCRWLCEQEGIPEQQMCYRPRADIVADDAFLSEQYLLRSGYRLPTEEEWVCVCRAGSMTPWFSGSNAEHLREFAWFGVNARERLWPAGMLRPNPLGLFDIMGNVSEWCQPAESDRRYVLRGGSYASSAKHVRSARRYYQSEIGYSFTGFRIARTTAVAP